MEKEGYFERAYNKRYSEALNQLQTRISKDDLWTVEEVATPIKNIQHLAITDCFNDLDARLKKLEGK
ncbi:MAG: hypothetical protein NWF00_05255 [Candidatus Bathyarchaeota archaeon]|nr:hypothetical protein [Candidatus Bathyarchaeota archaeon]